MQILLLVSLVLLPFHSVLADERFPRSPDPSLTPGSLCTNPDDIRYQERVPSCRRSVDVDTKEAVVQAYDRLGYRIRQMGRHQFKIDHYVPLCMGGSNEMSNLWPQHESIFALTDILEAECCRKMGLARLSQARALQYIKLGKAQPDRAMSILIEVQAL